MKRVFPLIPAVAALCIVFCGLEARCQPDTAPDTSAEPAQQPGEIPYAEQSDNELRLLNYILAEEAWHYRVFGLFRLERFTGDEADQAVLKALEDEAYQLMIQERLAADESFRIFITLCNDAIADLEGRSRSVVA